VLNIDIMNNKILFSENGVLNIDVISNRTMRVMCLALA
jgi:hypothetical protein